MSEKNIFNLLNENNLPLPKGIIQIGASYGQEIEMFKNNGINYCIMVEPLDAPFEYISKICKITPNYLALKALCNDADGEEVKFYIASNGGQSSSMLKPDKHLEIFDYVKFDNVININTTTTDNLFKFVCENGYSEVVNQIDTLYMDVQGAEYKVLLGSIKTLKKINYIYFEHIRGSLYENSVDLVDYVVLLNSLGFTLNYLNYDNTHHTNVLFVRKNILGIK